MNADPDIVIVGAGFAGLYMLHESRELGLKAVAFERGGGVGGTWYWNRYPGARCDAPSLDYSYSFSPELEQEWDWTELYATQPEILAYLEQAADRFDLCKDIRFNTTVSAATWLPDEMRWRIRTEQGDEVTSRYCVMATGSLSAPRMPDIPGVSDFRGEVLHTGLWPKEPVDFTGKRVGVIGTGSSSVQLTPVAAQTAARVVVFQRTPVFTVPARNRRHTPEEIAAVKAEYPRRREWCRMTGALNSIDITGEDGVTLRGCWSAGPRTYLGIAVSGFPNLFLINGPGSPSVLTNMPVSIEHHVEWLADLLAYLRDNELATVRPAAAAQDDWVETVNGAASMTLFPTAASWYMGANVPGKPRVFMPFVGGLGTYREICRDVSDSGYKGFEFR